MSEAGAHWACSVSRAVYHPSCTNSCQVLFHTSILQSAPVTLGFKSDACQHHPRALTLPLSVLGQSLLGRLRLMPPAQTGLYSLDRQVSTVSVCPSTVIYFTFLSLEDKCHCLGHMTSDPILMGIMSSAWKSRPAVCDFVGPLY